MLRRAGLALASVVTLGLLYQMLFSNQAEKDGPTPPIELAVDAEPDVYAQDVQFTQLHPDGTLHYKLHASTIRQFNRQQLTRMTEPRLRLLNPDQPPWDITANHGYIRKHKGPSGDTEEIVYLREAVELVQTQPNNSLITLRADYFYIYPDRQLAETYQDVMIDTDAGRTSAAGLQADLESGRLKLSSSSQQRVHTIVLPEQFKKSQGTSD